MGSRWGDGDPPEEAYSRVTRDLAAVTARYARWLDDLPARLTDGYACEVRELTATERARLERMMRVEHGYAVQPEDPAAATVLVGRWTSEGGAGATLAFGIAAMELVPDCFCDACDVESDELVEQAEDFLGNALGGCTEFRRPHRPRRRPPVWSRPWVRRWLEEGYESGNRHAAHSGDEVTGEEFTRQWRPWSPTSLSR